MTQVDIYCADPPTAISIPLGDGKIKTSGGYGGWELIDRPRRVSLTEWTKSEPFRLEIPVQFEGFMEGVSQEADIIALEALARRDDGNDPPPVILVGCPGGVPRDPGIEWVVEDIEWGDEEEKDDGGSRIRATATLRLLEFIEDEWLKVLSPSKRRKKRRSRRSPSRAGNPKSGGIFRVYVVKAGDTLQSIAASELGDRKRWKALSKKNKIRDPDKLEVGDRLRLL